MKKIIQQIIENYKLIIGVLFAGIFFGWILFHNSGNRGREHKSELTEEHDHSSEDPSLWTCSMHPQIKMDKPGKCPICAMDLIPLTTMDAGGDDVNPDEIVMSESAAKLASIQTNIVKRGVPEKTVYLQGKVQADERNTSELTSRFGGRIEKLFINFTGQNVKKGDKLATIYSPDLVTTQRELLEALASRESRPALYNAAKGKLKLWDLTDKQISAIEEKGEPTVNFDVLSPITGTVTMRHVSIGDYVKEGTSLFRIVDLTRLWVLFDAYESDLPWIKTGDRVDFSLQALPGKEFTARVTFIDPLINSQTRVAKVRVELANPGMAVKPEMFASGILVSKFAGSSGEVLVPKTSVLWTGKRAVVYVKIPDRVNPTFVFREIILGPEAGSYFVVADGLSEGEEIATNGVFKIDAAAQLIGLPSMMSPEGGMVRSAHNHGDMTADKVSSLKVDESEQERIPEEFKVQFTTFYSVYLEMKDAYVKSDVSLISLEAKRLIETLARIDMTLLTGDSHMWWMSSSKQLEQYITSIVKSDNIDNQRLVFSKLNDELYKAIKRIGLVDIKTYYQFCPMANGDKGAYWFSNSQEIRNPYFGDMMLTCGEVIEVIGR